MQPHDVDRLAQALDRPRVAHAVPALHDLRPADAEAEHEAPAGHRLPASSPSSPVFAGVRPTVCRMPLPSLMREVFAARYASGVAPSCPQASADQTLSTPSFSASSTYVENSSQFSVFMPPPMAVFMRVSFVPSRCRCYNAPSYAEGGAPCSVLTVSLT